MTERRTFDSYTEEELDALTEASTTNEPRLYEMGWKETTRLTELKEGKAFLEERDLVELFRMFLEGAINAGVPDFTFREFIMWCLGEGDFTDTDGCEVIW